MVLAQIYIPATMIWNNERIITTGNEFRFRTAPVDPNDPLRGKYIDLSFSENSFVVTNINEWKAGDQIFVVLTTDEQGFAKILSVSKEKPENEMNYVAARIGFIRDESLRIIHIEYPFHRFYMEESKALAAEQAYLESTGDSTQVTYALVRIKDGDAVIRDVIINGVPISQAAKSWQDTQN